MSAVNEVLIDNDNNIWLLGCTVDGTPVNDDTQITWELLDGDNETQVEGAMQYQAGTQGDYKGTLPYDTPLTEKRIRLLALGTIMPLLS